MIKGFCEELRLKIIIKVLFSSLGIGSIVSCIISPCFLLFLLFFFFLILLFFFSSEFVHGFLNLIIFSFSITFLNIITSFFGFFFLLFEVSVHKEIDHNVPFFISAQFSSQVQYFSCQKPEHKSNALLILVVAWDSNVYKVKWAVSIAKSNSWDVHVGRLSQGIIVGSWVTDNH